MWRVIYRLRRIKYSMRARLFGIDQAQSGVPRDNLHEYWRNPIGKANATGEYSKPSEDVRTDYLLSVLGSHAPDAASALEVGCNVGRNLEGLRSAGFAKLGGIEISEEAVANLRKTYPDLAAMADIRHGAVEDIIKTIPTDSYDVVFTMAVLMHIHPDSDWVFSEMKRIARQRVVVIEAEGLKNYRVFDRNYQSVFEAAGAKQMFNEVTPVLDNYQTRVFSV